jgi:hypothetical protein
VILAFLVPVVLFAPLQFTKKKLLRRHWYILFSIGLIFALLLSSVSVWSVWNPYALSGSLHIGNYQGASALSYPLWMNTYVVTVTLFRSPGGEGVVANVTFSVFIANVKLLQTNGTLSYGWVGIFYPGGVPVHYELGWPFFSNTTAFFSFLLLLFSLFNLLGFTLGMILCYVVSRALKSKSIGHIP